MAKITKISSRQTQRRSLEALLRPHFPAVYRLAYRLAGNTADAEDLVQDLFVKICARRQEFEALEQPRPWMLQVLYRIFLDGARRRQRGPVILADDSELASGLEQGQALDGVSGAEPGPPARLADDQRRALLLEAWNGMSEEHRSVLLLHDVEGYGLPELNIILDTPLGTLKSRLHRARKILRDSLLEMEPFADFIRSEK
jgi:RNA polymerase sigma factor (sigma-70 family)